MLNNAMMDFTQAQALLVDSATPPAETETVALALAAGRVLATGLKATMALPSADNSAMDGYVIRHADYRAGHDMPMPIQQRCYAGELPQPLKPGYATRIFTGSLIPDGGDTVVVQEEAHEVDGYVTFLHAPPIGHNIRRRGEDIEPGQLLLPAGTRLESAHIAILASQGIVQVPVFTRLRVGILSTGDEIVPPGENLNQQQIYNINGPMLRALVEGIGGHVALTLHARDNEDALHTAFNQLMKNCDLVLCVGGASVGERDLVKPVLHSLGAELKLWTVRMKPGKPVALAHVGGTPVVCLPGNPVSAFVVFTVLITPLIRRMQGRIDPFPIVSSIPLRTDQPRQDSREEFWRVQCRLTDNGLCELVPYPLQGSGIVSAIPWATGLARLPAGKLIKDSSLVAYYDLRHWLS